MLRAPHPNSLMHYPISGGTCLLAICLTLAWWLELDVSMLLMESDWLRQPWRVIGSTLLHGSVLHLAFNLYWLWVFGSFLEQRLGHLRTAAILLATGVGSGLAETAFMEGGVGLSGVGYGLFGYLWIRSQADVVRWHAVDRGTALIFLGWFFACIVLTEIGVMNVANIAHGAGAVLGVLLGLATVGWRGRHRRASAVAFGVALAGCIALATPPLRPYVSYSSTYAAELATEATHRLTQGDQVEAARLYGLAARIDPEEGHYWYCLYLACHRLGRGKDARDALANARRLEFELAMEEPDPLPSSRPGFEFAAAPPVLPAAPATSPAAAVLGEGEGPFQPAPPVLPEPTSTPATRPAAAPASGPARPGR